MEAVLFCGPRIEHWPGVIVFLGQDPFRKPRSLGEYIHREMRARGLSCEAFATEIGMSPGTLAKIAKDEYGVIDSRIEQVYKSLNRRYNNY